MRTVGTDAPEDDLPPQAFAEPTMSERRRDTEIGCELGDSGPFRIRRLSSVDRAEDEFRD